MDEDRLGAFCGHGRVAIAGAADGPLAGLTFAAKDLFDVAGVPTGAGNPDWLRTHDAPTRTAPAVQALLDAGARLVGKTHTDELAWSLNGENAHYGTPVNPRAPGRIPGGSSSGSASAVAGGAADTALGTDTGGSVRLPASYCGLYGLRPTHGRIALDGVVPLARSLDTVGWFARDAATLARVGAVLLPGEAGPAPVRLLVAEDAFAAAGIPVGAALAPAVARVAALFGRSAPVTLAPDGLDAWRPIFQTLQAAEAWAAHGAWIEAVRPAFGPGVRDRFAAAARLDPAAVAPAATARAEVRARLDDLLAGDAVVLLPTAAGPAPLCGASGPALDAVRNRALSLLCPAGLAGLPQIAMPAGLVDGCPVGLSLIAPRGADRALLDLALRLGDLTA
ncbi:amidase [Azospirillum sp. ST 5-10]|uniref:amidase n=1 Tax=unclassified Azospirillum TaxID=2630922 RepID=UPI003F49C599